MVSCPNCKTTNVNLLNSSPISFIREGENENKPKFYIGIFECPNCGEKFRSRVESISTIGQSDSKPDQTPNIITMVSRINEIRSGLIQTLQVLRDRIGTLETDRANLLAEVDDLRQSAESRASALENEVHDLREELKSLRELLGSK